MIDYDLTALIAARKKAGLSRTDISKLAKVTKKTIVNFENGRRPRSLWGHRVLMAYKHPEYPTRKKGLDDNEMDKCMKPQLRKRWGGQRGVSWRDRYVGKIDAAWLKRQTESFLRQNCTAIVERDRLAHFVLSTDAVYEYGRTILLAAGKNVG